MHRTWLEINLTAIKNNINNIRNIIGKDKIFLAAIKGNAWGYGTVQYVKTLVDSGVDWLGITTIEDAVQIRAEKIQLPMLLMCELPEEQVREALTNNLRMTICTKKMADLVLLEAAKLRTDVHVHIKMNTGLNRIGVSPGEFLPFVKYVASLPYLQLEGAFTHYSCADQIENKEKTLSQLHLFEEAIKKAEKAGFNFKILHTANTPAALALPETHLDMVRVGAGIAGLYPAEEFRKVTTLNFPVTWKTRVSFVRLVKPDEAVGYGSKYRCNKSTVVATIPVGTADGLSKRFENNGYVLIKGKKRKIAAISMDQTMIDLGCKNEETPLGEEVVILGKQKQHYLDPHIVAREINADVEELLSQINSRVIRVYQS